MPEISHVHFEVPALSAFNQTLRLGGAQSFPQWLAADSGGGPRISWWGLRDAPPYNFDASDDPARAALWPRNFDDWTEAPRGLVLATADADRAAADLASLIGEDWFDVGDDAYLGAHCRRLRLGRSLLVLAEPNTDGYVAASLATHGEGPMAVALDGRTSAGRKTHSNPVTDGPATWVRLGPKPAPLLIFIPPGA